MGVLTLVVGLVLGLGSTVFAQDAELIGELAKNAKTYRGYVGRVTSLEDGVLTLERRSGWTVNINLTEETTYGIPVVGEVTAQEFKTYVADAIATEETIKAVAHAERQEDGTSIANAVKIIPKLVAGEVTSASDTELILETMDGQLAIALTEDTRYGIPEQEQVTAEELMAYFEDTTDNDLMVKVAVCANGEDGTVEALGVKVVSANGAQRQWMRLTQRVSNHRLNRIVNRMGQTE